MSAAFHTFAATKTWFAEQFQVFPELPAFSVTRSNLPHLSDADYELPDVYEAMLSYRTHLQVTYQDTMNFILIIGAFIEAAQEAGKLTITEG